ncbi:MAG: DUF123 domain-containing protein [Nitrospinales bacterium]
MRTIPLNIQGLAENLGGIFLSELKDLPTMGAYALILWINKNIKINTGIHGQVIVPSGWYIYAGRASRGLGKRLERHNKRRKNVHWHIDHLTTRRPVAIQDLLIIPENPQWECEIIRGCLQYPSTQVPIIRFGNSDCSQGCPSHLIKMK